MWDVASTGELCSFCEHVCFQGLGNLWVYSALRPRAWNVNQHSSSCALQFVGQLFVATIRSQNTCALRALQATHYLLSQLHHRHKSCVRCSKKWKKTKSSSAAPLI